MAYDENDSPCNLPPYVQWNLSYPGSVGPRVARNFKIARNSELIHEPCTWLYKNTGHKYIKHENVKIKLKTKN